MAWRTSSRRVKAGHPKSKGQTRPKPRPQKVKIRSAAVGISTPSTEPRAIPIDEIRRQVLMVSGGVLRLGMRTPATNKNDSTEGQRKRSPIKRPGLSPES